MLEELVEEELLTLLREIEEKPALFLGRESISDLASFLEGYYYGKCGGGQFSSKLLAGFQKYIAQKYKMTSEHNWSSIILFFESDEARAFRKFFELFQKYLKLHQAEND